MAHRSFDPSYVVKQATVAPQEEVFIPEHAFTDFGLHKDLVSNILRRYQAPTQIQDKIIPQIMEGKDVVGLANTGTGKTAAFLIPLIHKVAIDQTQRVLIVAPTRELAVQIDQEFRLFSQNSGFQSAICIGGVSIGPQMERLRRRPHFVIGTPGRLKDLEQQRALDFHNYTTIVLDEVDQMLDMGFVHDVRYITSRLPTLRHSLFFSATLPDSVKQIMHGFLNNPVTISVKSRDTVANIDQDVIRLEGRSKVDVLHELLVREEFEKVLVFLRTKWSTEKLAQVLQERGIRADTIHGNKSQNQRQRAIDSFKKNYVKVLIATDVAARGIDINDVTHVINFDLPETYEDYIHRIGRTGRASKKGTALTFVG